MSAVFYAVMVLAVLLGAHDFVEARRGLRTGVVKGLMIGFGRKEYRRDSDPDVFWINIYAGFFFAAIGAIVLLWGIVVVASLISASLGQPTL